MTLRIYTQIRNMDNFCHVLSPVVNPNINRVPQRVRSDPKKLEILLSSIHEFACCSLFVMIHITPLGEIQNIVLKKFCWGKEFKGREVFLTMQKTMHF